jgi:orotate phosphoribosyltransferase
VTEQRALDVPTLLNDTGALLTGHFRLSSGLHSINYVQCALLLEDPVDAKMVGHELAEKLKSLDAARVVAPALGGVIIGFTVAEALKKPFAFAERKDGEMTMRRGFHVMPGERVLVVEDVVTTGKSTREAADAVKKQGGVVVGYGSILNRSGKDNPFDAPYAALLNLTLETFDEPHCPQCRIGAPIDSPGSRYSR